MNVNNCPAAARNVRSLPLETLAKVGTYLSPLDRTVAKKVFPAFKVSPFLLLEEFSTQPLFGRQIAQAQKGTFEERWQTVVQAVDQFLQKGCPAEDVEQCTYSEKISIGQAIIEKQIEFFEKIARLVPMAHEYHGSLSVDLSREERARNVSQWIFANRTALDAALQEELEDEEIQKIDVLLQELEYFPEELLLFHFKEEAWQMLYYIAKNTVRYKPLLQKLEAHRPIPGHWFKDAFSVIAHSGYLGLVKTCLNVEAVRRILEENPHSIANAIRYAAVEGHTEVVRAILSAEWFQDSPFRSAMMSTWRSIWIPPAFLAAAREHHVDVFRFLLDKLDMELDILAGWVYTALEAARDSEIARVVREDHRWAEIEPLIFSERAPREIDLRPRRRLQRTGGEIHQITSSRRVRPRLDIS